MYNLKMANTDGRNMYLYLINSKLTIRNIVVFLTIYICTINLLLLFDNTTGMTHLKTSVSRFSNFQAAFPNFAQITSGNILYSSQILTIPFHHHSLTVHPILAKSIQGLLARFPPHFTRHKVLVRVVVI